MIRTTFLTRVKCFLQNRDPMKSLLTPLLLAALPLTVAGQSSDQSSIWDRIFIGGGLGASFGSTYSFVEVSPLIGYWITDRWAAGAGFTYQYFGSKPFDYSTSIVGPRVFTRYHIFDWLFIHAEYEYLFLKYKDATLTDPISVRSPGLLVGGGLSYSIGSASSMYLMVLYNLLENRYTPYATNPVVRIGVNVGLR